LQRKNQLMVNQTPVKRVVVNQLLATTNRNNSLGIQIVFL
jgi:hypothetical protein